jgi:hypothetical protein
LFSLYSSCFVLSILHLSLYLIPLLLLLLSLSYLVLFFAEL